MPDLRRLYQEVITEHGRHPHNLHRLADANHTAEGFNPICGDRLTLYLKIDDDGVIKDVSFDGMGCTISMASASLMTDALKGKTVQAAEALFQGFDGLIKGQAVDNGTVDLGELEILARVKDWPTRIKCAKLPWHTLRAALAGQEQPVSTE